METDIELGDCDAVATIALAFVIVGAIILVVGLFNNVLLLHIILSNGQQTRTLPNIFIANMAVLDLFFLVIVNGGDILVFGQVAFQVKIFTNTFFKSLFYLQMVSSFYENNLILKCKSSSKKCLHSSKIKEN